MISPALFINPTGCTSWISTQPEKPIEGVTAEALAERARFRHRSVEYIGSMENGIDAVVEAATDGDLAHVGPERAPGRDRILKRCEGKLMAKEARDPESTGGFGCAWDSPHSCW
jgi:hypothetical protein